MSDFFGLTPDELEQIQNELKADLNLQIQKLITEMQDRPAGEGIDLVSMMAGKDSLALESAIEFSERAIEANNRKIADIMNSRDTLVLQTAIEFVQRAIEANNKKIFEYFDKKFNLDSGD
jgi:hypothetical protein